MLLIKELIQEDNIVYIMCVHVCVYNGVPFPLMAFMSWNTARDPRKLSVAVLKVIEYQLASTYFKIVREKNRQELSCFKHSFQNLPALISYCNSVF